MRQNWAKFKSKYLSSLERIGLLEKLHSKVEQTLHKHVFQIPLQEEHIKC